MKHYIWVAYSKTPPFLPIAVADTVKEIARLTGTTQSGVWSAWRHYSTGEYQSSRFHKVRI